MKYILVTGGVISGIGKGVVASSIATLLKSSGLRVTTIKIDPYFNIDAGTFSPYEHGEVFVLDDGGEVDLDLGNYERFLDVSLRHDNNITTGRIFQRVINDERKGKYLGKTVQFVPHVSDAIQDEVIRVAKLPIENVNGKPVDPEVCVIELGGTIGDIESRHFAEAFRQFHIRRVGKSDFCSVHVSLVPQPKSTGEQKTKPLQRSVMDLRAEGLQLDVIVCRSEHPITPEVKDKVSFYANVAKEQVIGLPDMPSIYHVPGALKDQGLVDFLMKRLEIEITRPSNGSLLNRWRNLAECYDYANKEVTIALIGKYTRLEDAYTSVIKALQHSCLHIGYRLKLLMINAEDLEKESETTNPSEYHKAWRQFHEAQGIIVPGGFGDRGINGIISAIGKARVSRIPFLGVCLGLQCAVIEFARSQLGLTDACSAESSYADKLNNKVIIEMPEHNPGNMGGTMRLGKKVSVFKHKDSIVYKLYGSKDTIEERHRHRYEVNPEYVPRLQEAGLRFVAIDQSGKRMEIIDIQSHPYFVGVQFHPEYLSRPLKPSPPYLGLILAAVGQLKNYVENNWRNSPRNFADLTDTESSDEELRAGLKTLTTTSAANCVVASASVSSSDQHSS